MRLSKSNEMLHVQYFVAQRFHIGSFFLEAGLLHQLHQQLCRCSSSQYCRSSQSNRCQRYVFSSGMHSPPACWWQVPKCCVGLAVEIQAWQWWHIFQNSPPQFFSADTLQKWGMIPYIREFKHQTLFATQTQTQRNLIIKANEMCIICHTLISHWPKNLGYVGFELTLQITFGA